MMDGFLYAVRGSWQRFSASPKKQLDQRGPIASQEGVRTNSSKETYSH